MRSDNSDYAPGTSQPDVVYEDRQVMVLTKPCGWLSQADGGDRPDVLEWARQTVAANRANGGRPFVGLCHRLDRQVGGLMAIAKSSKSAARISAQFRDRAVTKIYVALCLGKFGTPEGELAQALVRDGCLTRLARERESGTLCRLHYQVIDTGTIDGTQVSKLTVRLITGFKHQIRAQLASVGHPIYGDAHYGAPKIGPDSEAAIGLCSCQLSFSHPISGQSLEFGCEPELFWPFASFKPDSAKRRKA